MVGRPRTPVGEGGGAGRTAPPPNRNLTRHKAGWYVVCAVYVAGPLKSERHAELRRADIERVGECREEHTIVRHEGLACMCNRGGPCGPGGELP